MRWTLIGVCFAATWAIARHLFIGAMRESNAESRAVGRGQVYDPFLVDYGHVAFGGCVLVAILDGTMVGSARLPPWVRDLGVAAFILSCAVLLRVDAQLGAFFRTNGWAEGRLLVNGPYAWVRHPRYLCWIGMLVSIVIVANSLFGLLLAAGFLALVLRRIVREEAFMSARYGARYAEYQRHTDRLVPWVY